MAENARGDNLTPMMKSRTAASGLFGYEFIAIVAMLSAPDLAWPAEVSHITNSVGMEFVKIPSGSFCMGQDTGGDWDEAPAHQVTISQDFLMSVSEVTLGQYQKFRPAHQASINGKATGATWHDAEAYCQWLSKLEGKPYRLPTEAEWEYACRAGTTTRFWSGDAPPAESDAPNPWGIKTLYDTTLEWCSDWHGPYRAAPEVDPVGPSSGMVRVVRGDKPDNDRTPDDDRRTCPPYYHRSANRAGMPPAFGVLSGSDSLRSEAAPARTERDGSGLIGIHFGNRDFTRPLEILRLDSTENIWGGKQGRDWSARWAGLIAGPVDGEVTFSVKANGGVRLRLGNAVVIDGLKDKRRTSGALLLHKNEKLPVTLEYSCSRGNAELRLFWSWSGEEPVPVPLAALSYAAEHIPELNFSPKEDIFGYHAIGLRIVQAPPPPTAPFPAFVPFISQCVPRSGEHLKQAPDSQRPYFRKRYLLPIPPDNSPDREIAAAGLHPSFRNHNHCPILEVCPNGDLLMIIYTSYREYEPGVSLIGTRLRFGADQWEMPEPTFDQPDANDHAPLLWTDWADHGRMYFFWGSPGIERGGMPFQWMTSSDSGATWSEVHYPQFVGTVGPHARQPLNTALRGSDGTLYVASDAVAASSLLWATKDNGKTWYDTGGRSAGRHTSYCLLKDGRILGMGGKNSNIGGYMPKVISADGGRTWAKSKTPFAAQSSNQRPSLLRLASGRLLFAGDFQNREGEKPPGISQSGSYVALSEDEGESWRVKRIPMAQSHESDRKAATLGYSAVRQAPNGMIHLITSMNTPCLHFEMNESWILSDDDAEATDADLMSSRAKSVAGVKACMETYPTGRTKARWEAGIGNDGRYLLHGPQVCYFETGQKQYEARFSFGKKVGQETLWRADGSIQWQWQHREDGSSVWTQYWENGRKKAQSTWRDFLADGPATCWDRSGALVSEVAFSRGKME
jgi:formylglycine-generating enzyme required for sulfatase activity